MIEVIAYLGSILLANWLVITYHLIGHGQEIMPWLPITFPAGAAVIGLTFSARDFVQRKYGHGWTWVRAQGGLVTESGRATPPALFLLR